MDIPLVKALERREFARQLDEYLSPTNPVRQTELLQGREPQLKQIERALQSSSRTVFVYGPRGVGKTSLAITSAVAALPMTIEPIYQSCDDQNTSIFRIVKSIVEDLLGRKRIASESAIQAKLAAGPFEISGSKSAQPIPEPTSINDAARFLIEAVENWRSTNQGPTPIVIIDEFDQMPSAKDRQLFGDLIKQIGDRRIKVNFIFCGVADSLDDVLEGHESAYRYIESVALDRLSFDARMKILEAAAERFHVGVHRDHLFRTAQISDGFPYYVRLIGEQMFWEYFDDPKSTSFISHSHFEAAISRAVNSCDSKLSRLYAKATRTYTGGWDYLLWAAAAHPQLERSSNAIYEDYCDIVKVAIRLLEEGNPDLPEVTSSNEARQDPFDKTRFRNKMNALKLKNHGHVLSGTRSGWYKFAVPMLRGYCRLLARKYGIDIGGEYNLSTPLAL